MKSCMGILSKIRSSKGAAFVFRARFAAPLRDNNTALQHFANIYSFFSTAKLMASNGYRRLRRKSLLCPKSCIAMPDMPDMPTHA